MLVLSRKPGERVRIGKDVVITVTQIERGKVRLGIEAPLTLPVWRDELLTQEKKSSSRPRAVLAEIVIG